MSISITCECGRYFETSESNAGRRAQCPGCGHVMTLPHPVSPPEIVFLPDDSPPPTSGKAIASLAFGGLFFFACLSGIPAIFLLVGLAAIPLGCWALIEINRSGGRLGGRKIAVTGIVLGIFGGLFAVTLDLAHGRSVREAGRRAQCLNNLRQIALAMDYYMSANGCLPPAAITDKAGKPLLSWRVAILPYLGKGAPYWKFHLDEPWDSPHNLTVLDSMPAFYACPGDTPPRPGMTGYQVVVGPDTLFTPDFKPMKAEDIIDGLIETILVVETRRAVPWTKPEDLPFDTPLPLHGLGSHHGNGNVFNVVYASGFAKFHRSTIAPNALRALLTRNGNEVVNTEGD